VTERATPNSEILAPRALRSLADRSVEKLLLACALVCVVAMIALPLTLLAASRPLFHALGSSRPLAETTRALALGSFVTTTIAILVALPLGLGAAVFLSEFADAATRRWMKPALDLLAAVPTVVYGYFALQAITPLFQTFLPGLEEKSALSAGFAMGIMILPLVASRSEEALSAVPKSLREGAYALGVSKWKTVRLVVLPASLSGLLAATVLAAVRGLGEAIIVFVAAGFTHGLSLDPRAPTGTLAGSFLAPANLAALASGSTEASMLCVIGVGLVAITVSLDALASRLGDPRKQRPR